MYGAKASPSTAAQYLSAIASASALSEVNPRRSFTRRSSSSESISGSSLSTHYILGSSESSASDTSEDSPVLATSPSAGAPLRIPPLPPANALSIKPARHFDSDPNWIPRPEDPHCLRHSEFGWDENEDYRYTSQWRGPDADNLQTEEEEPSLLTYLTTCELGPLDALPR